MKANENIGTDSGKLPIFVLGCQRSGTSLVRRLLNSHTNIACPPESAFLVQLARVYEVKRALQGLINMGFAEAEVLEQMRTFTTHFFEKYAKAKGKRRWADKTPHYLSHVETIDRMFNREIVYVAIVRHGLDVAYSLCGFEWGVLEPYLVDGTEKPIAAIRFWREQNSKLINFMETAKGRVHLVKFEELTAEPTSVVKGIFDFIGEPWEESVLNYNDVPHDSGFEDPKIFDRRYIESNSGNYKHWTTDLQLRAYREAESLLGQFGYSL